MNQKSLFSTLTFLTLALISQEAVAMKGAGQRYTNNFRIGMKMLNHATLMALPMYLGSKKFQNPPSPLNDPEATTVEPEIEKFVLNTCFEAYPELKNRTIKVLQSPNSTFAAGVSADCSVITVPKHLKNNELENAMRFKEKKLYRLSYADSEKLAKKNNCSVYELLSLQKQNGIAADPYTLDTWHGIILHEGSHLLHRDTMKDNAMAIVAPAIVLYSTGKLKQFLGLNVVFPKYPILGNILRALGYIPSFPLQIIANACLIMGPMKYWSEYRADQDAIKRAQDPEILKAMSIWVEYMPKQDESNLPTKIKLLSDPHPKHTTRAAYFKEAALKLEAQQAACKN